MKQETKTEGSQVPHNRYTKTKRSTYSSQHDCAEAWAQGKYPVNNTTGNRAHLKSSSNFRAVQREDGSGRLIHYRTTEAIRTRFGDVIGNTQCWSSGFAHCTKPSATRWRLPLDAIRQKLDDEDRLRDILHVREAEGDHDAQIVTVEGADYSIFVGEDRSQKGRGDFLLRLDGDDADMDAAQVYQEKLRPEKVRESDLRVVDSSSYTKTRWRNPTDEEIEREGLQESTGRYRSHYLNHKQYRDDLQGQAIVRQGEYFFLPRPGYEPQKHHDADRSVRKELGNHDVVREDGIKHDAHGNIYVRGLIGHRYGDWTDGDHDSVNLGETWHLVVEETSDVEMVDHGRTGSTRID